MILLVKDDREYLCEPGEELHTDLGVIEVPEVIEPGETIESHLDEEFRVRELRGPDFFNHLERTGAPMMPKDIGIIIGKTGVGIDDRVLDAGTGTGILAAYLGRIGASVVTFEENPEFADVARQNMERASVAEQVEVRTGDITQYVSDLPEFNVITLDTEDAPQVVGHADRLLQPGGFIAVYSPFIEAARQVEMKAHDVGLSNVTTEETIQREMEFDERGSRPTTAGVGHTGYLTFGRR
ncbi:MAG: methyltransferase domain-containing protein [Halobacteriaceae archaeon]